MHCARSETHFDYVARVGMVVARQECHLPGYTLTPWYDTVARARKTTWHGCRRRTARHHGMAGGGASEEVGVTCSNNDIESFWRNLKANMLTSRRVGHRMLLEDVFPKMSSWLRKTTSDHQPGPATTSVRPPKTRRTPSSLVVRAPCTLTPMASGWSTANITPR